MLGLVISTVDEDEVRFGHVCGGSMAVVTRAMNGLQVRVNLCSELVRERAYTICASTWSKTGNGFVSWSLSGSVHMGRCC